MCKHFCAASDQSLTVESEDAERSYEGRGTVRESIYGEAESTGNSHPFAVVCEKDSPHVVGVTAETRDLFP